MKYGDARQIARVLTDMFIGGSSSTRLDSADNQIAPGSGTSATSSADRLSLNANSPSIDGRFRLARPHRQHGGAADRPRRADGRPAIGNGAGGALDSGRGAAATVSRVLQDVRITPDAVNNTLLIYADQANYRIIEATLQQIDQPQLQVAIDATIAEVTLNNELSYGVQTYLTSKISA